MFNSLYRRLLAVILAFGLAMTGIFAVVLLVYHEAYHTEADQTVNRRLAQQYANARLLITDEPLTVRNFHEGIDKLADLNPDVDIYLLDARGGIVASSVPATGWARGNVGLEPVHAFLGGEVSLHGLNHDAEVTKVLRRLVDRWLISSDQQVEPMFGAAFGKFVPNAARRASDECKWTRMCGHNVALPNVM